MEQMLDELIRNNRSEKQPAKGSGGDGRKRGAAKDSGGSGAGAAKDDSGGSGAGDGHSKQAAENQNQKNALAFRAAAAVVGGRVSSVARALSLEEFRDASFSVVEEFMEKFKDDVALTQMAKEQEEKRFNESVDALRRERGGDDPSRRDDTVWVDMQHSKLMEEGTNALQMSMREMDFWCWIFSTSEEEDRRFYA
jgi:hypothetical protein